MNPKVYAPNVHLFAFHLRNNSDSEAGLTAKNNLLWQKCDEIFDKLDIRELSEQGSEKLKLTPRLDLNKQSDSPRFPLLKDVNGKIFLPFTGTVAANGNQLLKIAGLAFPLQTYDSYALWLNLRRPEREDNGQKTENVDIELLSKFNPENCLILQGGDRFLGQTLLITVWLTEEQKQQTNESLRQLADQCLNKLIPDDYKRPPFNQAGYIFGSPIFEYGLFSQLFTYHHILVWLFCQPETDEKFGKCYNELLDLFFYRHKIIKAYQRSYNAHDKIENKYKDIRREIKNIEEVRKVKGETLNEDNLNQFKMQIKDLPQTALKYAELLQFLEDSSDAISINIYDYKEKLRQISNILPNDDLEFLERFSSTNSPHFQEQIKAYLRYFGHGAGLIDKAIASIRGIVEIDQAERDRSAEEREKQSDRKLETTIAVVGVGLAVTEIVGSSTPYIIRQEDLPKPIKLPFTPATLHPFFQSLLLSLTFGVVAAAISGILITLWQRRRDDKAKLEGRDRTPSK